MGPAKGDLRVVPVPRRGVVFCPLLTLMLTPVGRLLNLAARGCTLTRRSVRCSAAFGPRRSLFGCRWGPGRGVRVAQGACQTHRLGRAVWQGAAAMPAGCCWYVGQSPSRKGRVPGHIAKVATIPLTSQNLRRRAQSCTPSTTPRPSTTRRMVGCRTSEQAALP
jgi:hypothetical protein